MTAEQFARRIAQRHLATDPGLREIMYLPENAPANEIRLIEVNVSALLPDEFTPEIQGWRSTDS